VFGPETTGLSVDELLLCGRPTRIPSHPEQPSLNLSHAAMVACYEVYRAQHPRPPATAQRATHDQKESLLELWLQGLQGVEALPRGDLRGLREWRRFFSRLDLTPRELGLLSHVARKMARAGSGTRRADGLQGGNPHVS
jgi:tRNA/rRNA methyltransferase